MLYIHAKDISAAEHHLILSLCLGANMHVATTAQALTALCKILQDRLDTTQLKKLQQIILTHKLIATAAGSTAPTAAAKRVAVAIDYSGSMAGSKIKAAVNSLQELVNKHIFPDDLLLIIKFNHTCDVVLPLTLKRGNEDRIAQLISKIDAPNGGTALYDAIVSTINALARRKHQSTDEIGAHNSNSDWVVVLTDGMEGCSRGNSKSSVEDAIRHTPCGIIIVGVGEDVDTKELEGLTQCAKNGFFVSAVGNEEGITAAFGQVAVLIQGQVILEEI